MACRAVGGGKSAQCGMDDCLSCAAGEIFEKAARGGAGSVNEEIGELPAGRRRAGFTAACCRRRDGKRQRDRQK